MTSSWTSSVVCLLSSVDRHVLLSALFSGAVLPVEVLLSNGEWPLFRFQRELVMVCNPPT